MPDAIAIERITDALDRVMEMEGVIYVSADGSRLEVGLLVDKAEKQFPECIKEMSWGEKIVIDRRVVPLLVEAFKSLHGKVMSQGRDIEKLNKRIR